MKFEATHTLKQISEAYRPEEVIFLDTETTGLDHDSDEILELAIIDGRGNILYSQRFSPQAVEEWPIAQSVNHISPADVEGLVTIKQCRLAIQHILDRAKAVVCFNAPFDLGFLDYLKFRIPAVIGDVQKDGTDFVRPEGWLSLASLCSAYGFYVPNAHNALADACATAVCARKLVDGTQPEPCSSTPIPLGISGSSGGLHYCSFGRFD